MPIEVREADAVWLPGPVNGTAGRPAMAFTGRPMGVCDHTLSAKSTARQIMRKVGLSRKFCMEVIRQTRGHVEAWQAAHETPDGGGERASARTRLGDQPLSWSPASSAAMAGIGCATSILAMMSCPRVVRATRAERAAADNRRHEIGSIRGLLLRLVLALCTATGVM